MDSKLTSLSKQLSENQYEAFSKESMEWLKRKTANIQKNAPAYSKQILKERDRHVRKNQLWRGEVCFFLYDPKYADSLPYYDIFPLVIVLDKYNDGILGLNLHYLPVPMRAAFMDKLMKYKVDSPDRLKVTYDILSGTSKYKQFIPCIKRYLDKQMGSNYLKVEENEWETALFLPVQQFKKSNSAKVWKDSIHKIQGI